MMGRQHTDPFDDFTHLRRRLYGLLDRGPVGGPETPTEAEWTPAGDVIVTQNEVVIALELAGMARDQINVSLEERTLTVSGRRQRAGNGDAEQPLHSEWGLGEFSRSFALGWEVDADNIKAALTDGVLEIRVPRKQ
jgi:HSP20 family protein